MKAAGHRAHTVTRAGVQLSSLPPSYIDPNPGTGATCLQWGSSHLKKMYQNNPSQVWPEVKQSLKVCMVLRDSKFCHDGYNQPLHLLSQPQKQRTSKTSNAMAILGSPMDSKVCLFKQFISSVMLKLRERKSYLLRSCVSAELRTHSIKLLVD